MRKPLAAILLLLAGAAPARASAATVPRPKDLSVEELVGQTFMIAIDTGIADAREADIRAGRLSGGLLRWDRFTGDEARAFAVKMRAWSRDSPHRIPFWIAADYEGGAVAGQHGYGLARFPGNMALGAAGSEELARESARETARELRALGVSIAFAPDLDLSSKPSPIIGIRAYGDEPALAARLGAAAVRGYQEGGVLAVPKHFPGHGGTPRDSHRSRPVDARTRAELDAADLVPFRAAFAAGAEAVMPAHVVFPALDPAPGRPATLSSATLQGFLRGELGFRGLIVTDSLDMAAITDVYGSSESAVLALLAGDDVLLIGKGDSPAAFAAVVDAVKTGRVPRARLEDAVGRILEAKRRLGLFGAPDPAGLDDALLAPGRDAARRAAEAAVTLVRDDGLLPLRLRPEEKLALVVVRTTRYPAEAAFFAAEIARRHARTIFIDLPDISPGPRAIDAAVARVRGAAVVIVGTFQYGDPALRGQTALLRRLTAGPAPVVAVSLMDPYDLTVSKGARAAICTYGMTESALTAAARLIFGEIRPRGRLPVRLPAVGPADGT